MKKYYFIVLVLAFTAISCKDVYIERLVEMSSFIDNNEWNYSSKDDAKRIYIITQDNNNVYSELKFRVDEFKGKEDIIIEYHFTRKKAGDTFEYAYLSKNDTLCHYFENGKRDFVSGRYYFLYEIERFKFQDFNPDIKQVDYYYENRDSLIRVKGNDLPDLPFKE